MTKIFFNYCFITFFDLYKRKNLLNLCFRITLIINKLKEVKLK